MFDSQSVSGYLTWLEQELWHYQVGNSEPGQVS